MANNNNEIGYNAISAVWLTETNLTNLNSGIGGSNIVDIKKYKKQGLDYPYVSGQAMRYYLKEAIRRDISTDDYCVPDDKGQGCGKIEKCILCDLFGFMRPEEKVGSDTRVSPVKMSPAMGLLPFQDNAVIDFLTQKKPQEKGKKQEGAIVNVEIGINLYKAGMAIDLVKVGGEETIDFEKHKSKGISYKVEPVNNRKKRIKTVLEAFKHFADYSKQARVLTDFTPDIILISLQTKYHHLLQKAFELKNNREDQNKKEIDTDRLDQVLTMLKLDKDIIYAGIISGAIDNETSLREVLNKHNIEILTPKEAINKVIDII